MADSWRLRVRLAQARLKKLRGQPATFLSPLVQLRAMDDPESHKSQQGNQRGQSQRTKDLDGEIRLVLGKVRQKHRRKLVGYGYLRDFRRQQNRAADP